MTKEMCDLKTLSEYLCVSDSYIRKLVYARLIPYYKIGNRLRFDIHEINDWVEEHKQEERRGVLYF